MATASLREDIAELQSLLATAQRQKVKDTLSVQIAKWQSEVVRIEEQEKRKAEKATEKLAERVQQQSLNSGERVITKELRQYAWDQSEKFMKLYVDMPGVHTVPLDNVTASYQTRYVKVTAKVNDTCYQLAVGPFHADVVTDDCKLKVKTDKILVMLKKQKEGQTWPYVISKKTEEKKKMPSMGEDDDPSKGLMTMLQQMYDDGDDDMKRTIAKSWYDSQNKKGGEGLDMPM